MNKTTKIAGCSDQFKIGDKVVYPGQGAAIIQRITRKLTPLGELSFYVLHLVAQEGTVMVPISSAQMVGLRAAGSKKDLEDLFSFLRDKPDKLYLGDWKAQERDYVDKITGGSLLEIARIVKALYLRSLEKSLSFKRRKMLDHSWDVMVSEIAAVKGITQSSAAGLVRQALTPEP